ncbi:uncharacterized protein LOC114165383 [Vigna unguiculata]|uniref:uncharacterized protein LOC114165383 n=1 Tax=Vigna unguiculata TaxID=3917 RepID=UPI00101660B4|nr:uncharacterized protein LOC114165383 [Vigna unguiculata]
MRAVTAPSYPSGTAPPARSTAALASLCASKKSLVEVQLREEREEGVAGRERGRSCRFAARGSRRVREIGTLNKLYGFSSSNNRSHIPLFGTGSFPLPVFTGENFDIWKLKLKTYFISQKLWDIVQSGYTKPDNIETLSEEERKKLEDSKQKDAQALFILQQVVGEQVVGETIARRIMDAETAKRAWDILEEEFEGNEQEKRVVEKILITLTEKYDSIVASIETSLDPSSLSISKLVGLLGAHEARLSNRADTNSVENAFQSKLKLQPKKREEGEKKNIEEYSRSKDSRNLFGNKKDKYPPCGICNKSSHAEKDYWHRWKPIWHYCKKPGHVEKYCRNKNKHQENFAEEYNQEQRLFYANQESPSGRESWYLDSGCSNHMAKDQSIFKYIDKSVNVKVQLGNGAIVESQGKGNVMVEIKKGTKFIKDVLLVPNLKENLLSIGQMMENGQSMESKRLTRINPHRCLWPDEDAFTSQQQAKSKVFGIFKKFKALVEKQSGKQIKVLRSDRGKEYTSREFDKFCEDESIKRQLTVAYTPQQNCVSKRKNRTVMEMARSMLKEKDVQLRQSKTRLLLKLGVEESHKPNTYERHKLEDKTIRGIFLGYSTQSKEYRVYNLQTKKLTISRDIEVDESATWNWEEEQIERKTIYMPNNQPTTSQEDNDQDTIITPESPATPTSIQDQEESSPESTPRRIRSLTNIYESCNLAILEPGTIEEAAKQEEGVKAMKEEIKIIEKNNTLELADYPKDKDIIGVKWVFKTKLNPDGTIHKHKARLVAKGYSQQPRVDYNETFAPVARLDTIRTLIALAAQKGWSIYQLDFKSAFLNGVLEEEIYIEQPPGFVVKGQEAKVLRLKKALYGLKQVPRAWYINRSIFHQSRIQEEQE